jgi:two-component system, OmpR family, phosphate regulon sensor histidine kinase PhoR
MPSLSLQTHLVTSCPHLPAISVDPRGFKLALQSLTKFLIDQQVPATLWLKLPKDKAWWTDVWTYGQQAAGCCLYTLGESHPPDNLAASLRAITIEQDEDLKREYLCVAVAPNFVCVLLAVRTPPAEQGADKRTIKLYCSTAGRSLAAVSAGLKHIIESGLPSAAEPSELADSAATASPAAPASPAATMASRAVLSQWDRCFPADVLRGEMPLTEAFLSWQLQSQEELRSQLATYRNAIKNEAHSLSPDFLAQAGQELQSPLTTIKTALTLLGSPTLKMAQRQRYLEMITAQCDRQKSLINSVVNLLKAQTTATLTPRAIQLADMIPGIVSTYQPIAEERGIMLAHTIPAHLSEVLSVESDLKEVVIQLINNGIQITPQGGRVWVSAASHSANFVALTVQDSGAGLSKNDTAKLFDAFYHNPSSREGALGSGLGLTLVQQLVNRMGGSISVESEFGRGTTFKILLPTRPIVTAPSPMGEPVSTSSVSASSEFSVLSNHPAEQKMVASH